MAARSQMDSVASRWIDFAEPHRSRRHTPRLPRRTIEPWFLLPKLQLHPAFDVVPKTFAFAHVLRRSSRDLLRNEEPSATRAPRAPRTKQEKREKLEKSD